MQLQVFLSSRPALLTCSVSVLRRPGIFQSGMWCACRIRMMTSYAKMQHPRALYSSCWNLIHSRRKSGHKAGKPIAVQEALSVWLSWQRLACSLEYYQTLQFLLCDLHTAT